MKENKLVDFERALDRITLPTVATPLHKEWLKVALMAQLPAAVSPHTPALTPLLLTFLARLRRHALPIAVPVLLMLFAVFSWQTFFMVSPTLAYVTIQANPALQLTVDLRGRVTELLPLTPQTALIFAPDDFRHTLATNAMAEIVGRMHREGFLQANSQLALLLHSEKNLNTLRFDRLARSLRRAADSSLIKIAEGASLRSYTVSAGVSAQSRVVGLLPLDLVMLFDAEIEEETLLSLFRLKDQLNLDERTFSARFPAMAKKIVKALRERTPKEEILELGRKSMATDEDTEDEPEDDDGQGRDKDDRSDDGQDKGEADPEKPSSTEEKLRELNRGDSSETASPRKKRPNDQPKREDPKDQDDKQDGGD